MKKVLGLLMMLAGVQMAFADGTANINIRLNGPSNDNRYFLCLPNIGCLSVLAAQRGKIYPIMHSITLDNMYVLDTSDHFRLYPQGIAPSCHLNVDTGRTVTISGSIVQNGHNVHVNQLHCSVR